MAMDSQGAQRPGLMLLTQKHHKVPLKSFLGYHANGHEGLEGAHRATETSCVPLLENQALTKFSWVLFCLWGTLGELENPEFQLVFINFNWLVALTASFPSFFYLILKYSSSINSSL